MSAKITSDTLQTSQAEDDKPKTSEELQELFQMKKKILLRDHDINKVTNRLKQIQLQELEEAREISQNKTDPRNIKVIKSKVLDYKKEIRRKEELLELEENKIQRVRAGACNCRSRRRKLTSK